MFRNTKLSNTGLVGNNLIPKNEVDLRIQSRELIEELGLTIGLLE